MAPNTTGHGDDFLSARLCRRVLELAHYLLKPGGSLVMKILEGTDMPEVLKETKALFEDAGASKPAASRDISRETFIWGKRFRPVPLPHERPEQTVKPVMWQKPAQQERPAQQSKPSPKEKPDDAPGAS
jgi:hypothetical protein